MRFEAAIFWLALPALLIWVAWLARRSYAQLSPSARWGSAALRLVILVALIGALSRPIWLRPTHSQHVLFVLDASRSITKDNLEAALTDIDRLAAESTKQGHRVSVIAFGRRPRLLVDSATAWKGWAPEQRDLLLHETALPAMRSHLAQLISQSDPKVTDKEREDLQKRIGEVEDFHTSTISDSSDARAALRLALNTGATAQGDARTIYLFTDANFNASEQSAESGWREMFTAAKAAGHTIHTIALDKPIGPEVAAVDLTVPPSVRVNQGFAADLRIASTVQTPAKIVVYRDGYAMAEIAQSLHPGENTVHIPGLNFRDKGFHTIDAAVRVDAASDTRVENNRARVLMTVPGELRVLYVDSDEAHQSFLTSALSLEGVQVEARPASGVPQSLDDLLGFDCFILANVPADKLGAAGGRQMQMIRTYVQDFGGGFIMIGGDQSFGLGGYYNTPVEEVLPVRMPIQKDLNRPSIAIEILIDKSGSMEGPKMQLAKRAAVATSEAINPRDQIGVVAFDSDAREILPLTPAGDRAAISAGIASLDAGGGTFLYPAMEIAHNTLQQSTARRKHCIIVSDGMTEGFGYPDMAALMAADGITISTVGIGGDADMKMMESIATSGAGRSYFTNDFNTIPQIFTREALRASNSMLVERLVLPTSSADDECLSEVDSGQLPPLAGYVATTPKETAKVVIISDSGDPILARWRSGLGRTAAFTSDTKPHWAEDWIRWPDFAKFWAQLVRSCAGHEVAKDLSIETGRRLEDGAESNRLTLELRDAAGGFVNDRIVELTAFDTQSGSHPIAVQREAPGLFAAVAPQGEYGRTQQFAWRLSPLPDGGPGAPAGGPRPEPLTIPFGFVDSFSPEFRTLGADQETLRQIREQGAGDVVQVGQASLHLPDRSSSREIPLWPYLLALALAVVPLDILARRLG